ncbi:hypothetical protein FHR70_003790 [Microvirga lupini]|uniref:Uncharacterized protein n=1 Tax=Microvirga lupini TaxID=420324 RepID=A0A7W4YYV5_9HYPH|nr:hypothetical protein [Microvirga lupini]MBB3020704.1 hypothetical protein [Microvirga lupini]
MDFRERARRVIPDRYEGEGWNQARNRAEAEIRRAYEDGKAHSDRAGGGLIFPDEGEARRKAPQTSHKEG